MLTNMIASLRTELNNTKAELGKLNTQIHNRGIQ